MYFCIPHSLVWFVLFFYRYMGDGLVTALDYDGWALRRKALDPMFHRGFVFLIYRYTILAAAVVINNPRAAGCIRYYM